MANLRLSNRDGERESVWKSERILYRCEKNETTNVLESAEIAGCICGGWIRHCAKLVGPLCPCIVLGGWHAVHVRFEKCNFDY